MCIFCLNLHKLICNSKRFPRNNFEYITLYNWGVFMNLSNINDGANRRYLTVSRTLCLFFVLIWVFHFFHFMEWLQFKKKFYNNVRYYCCLDGWLRMMHAKFNNKVKYQYIWQRVGTGNNCNKQRSYFLLHNTSI